MQHCHGLPLDTLLGVDSESCGREMLRMKLLRSLSQSLCCFGLIAAAPEDTVSFILGHSLNLSLNFNIFGNDIKG